MSLTQLGRVIKHTLVDIEAYMPHTGDVKLQAEVAFRAGIRPETLSRWMNVPGDGLPLRRPPDESTVERIGTAVCEVARSVVVNWTAEWEERVQDWPKDLMKAADEDKKAAEEWRQSSTAWQLLNEASNEILGVSANELHRIVAEHRDSPQDALNALQHLIAQRIEAWKTQPSKEQPMTRPEKHALRKLANQHLKSY